MGNVIRFPSDRRVGHAPSTVLRGSVRREREVRNRVEATEALRQEFIGMLGHDLRNPLNTVLTTTRLMLMRGELPLESAKRIERVIASGVRMQRMIDQLLDIARDRVDSGFPIVRGAPQDLRSIVAKVIEELRAERPGIQFVKLTALTPCTATVDASRIGQVVTNLVTNALAHGEPGQPIEIEVTSTHERVVVEVRNQGPAIDPETLALLFDPLKRRRRTAAMPDGLGLGLYISDRIVRAHGGALEVDSSAENGTCFRIELPCKHEAPAPRGRPRQGRHERT